MNVYRIQWWQSKKCQGWRSNFPETASASVRKSASSLASKKLTEWTGTAAEIGIQLQHSTFLFKQLNFPAERIWINIKSQTIFQAGSSLAGKTLCTGIWSRWGETFRKNLILYRRLISHLTGPGLNVTGRKRRKVRYGYASPTLEHAEKEFIWLIRTRSRREGMDTLYQNT